MKTKECEKSSTGKHEYVDHTQPILQESGVRIDGTKVCKFCQKEITNSQYMDIEKRTGDERYHKIKIAIAIIGIIVIILIAIFT